MRDFSLAFSAAAFALATALAGGALADVAPPDQCNGAVGTTCSNAGPNGDQPGVCTNEMCPHTGPGPDGGLVTTENPCVLCEPQATTATTGATTGAGGGATGAGGGSSSGGSSGGCSIGVRAGDGMIAGTMLTLGLGVLIADRRRRRRA